MCVGFYGTIPPMIYDCFSFFNELDLLEIRLNVLKDVVDRFVLVEAGETHSGRPKPLYFKENEERFAAFRDRLVYVCIEKFPPVCATDWARENYQRNAVAEGLKDAKDDDVVLISDLDEIPRPEKIAAFAGRPGVTVFDQTYYAFYLNYRNVRQQWWYGTRMLSCRDFRHAFDGVKVAEDEFLPSAVNEGTTASKIRCRRLPRSRGGQRIVKDGGWHFTCLGGAEALARKIASFAHQEYNPGEGKVRISDLEEMIRAGKGPFWEMRCFVEEIDGTYPDYIRRNAASYPALVLQATADGAGRRAFARWFQTARGKVIGMCERAMPAWFGRLLHGMKVGVRRVLARVRVILV